MALLSHLFGEAIRSSFPPLLSWLLRALAVALSQPQAQQCSCPTAACPHCLLPSCPASQALHWIPSDCCWTDGHRLIARPRQALLTQLVFARCRDPPGGPLHFPRQPLQAVLDLPADCCCCWCCYSPLLRYLLQWILPPLMTLAAGPSTHVPQHSLVKDDDYLKNLVIDTHPSAWPGEG